LKAAVGAIGNGMATHTIATDRTGAWHGRSRGAASRPTQVSCGQRATGNRVTSAGLLRPDVRDVIQVRHRDTSRA
jgi:hypothetical protein